MKNIFTAAVIAAGLLGASMAPAKATPEVIVGASVTAPATAVIVGIAAGAAVLAHEAFARKPFGNNGEGMKVLHGAGRAIKKIRIRW